MKNLYILMILPVLLNWATVSHAQITVYDSEVAFSSDYPDLAVEDFEATQVASNNATECGTSLNSTTDDACVNPEDIVTGVNIRTNLDGNLIAVGSGLGGSTSKSVAPNIAHHSLILEFSPSVRAVAMNQVTFYSATDTPVLKLFDAHGNVLFNQEVSSSQSGVFIGLVSATTPIASLEIFSVANAPEAVDDLRFKEFTEADINLYSDRAIFEARNPELNVEGFEETKVEDNTAKSCGPVANSETTDECFSCDGISRGVEITTTQNGALAVFGAGQSGLPGKAVAPNIGIHTLKVSFDPAVLQFSLIQHSTSDDTPLLKLFDVSDQELLSTSIDSSQAGDFLGIESQVGIGSFTIFSADNKPELLGEISFPAVSGSNKCSEFCVPIKTSNGKISLVCL